MAFTADDFRADLEFSEEKSDVCARWLSQDLLWISALHHSSGVKQYCAVGTTRLRTVVCHHQRCQLPIAMILAHRFPGGEASSRIERTEGATS